MGEYSTVYSKNTCSAIKKYLESNTYPEEITSLEWKKTKKYRKKKNFRDIIGKDQRFKLISSDDSKKVNNFIRIGIKRKEKI